MKRTRKLPELLAPAGSFDALVAAILGGADAVYLGGLRFGARAFAENFGDDELPRAIKLCHMFGVRLYVTINTLIYDKEMNEAFSYAKSLYDMGVDALIIADLGLALKIKKELPDFELHASTQMGVHNIEGVNLAKKLGCNRVVLARECSASDIKTIAEKSNAECEVFVHGALCVCHSGQCLFSSMVGGRSGNRGECAQPCRLPYNKDRHILSLRDLSLANYINELIDSGVSSLKIEGRMKSASYVYEVTRIYRTLLDQCRGATEAENRRLSDVFSRSGFTDGYFKGSLFSKMTGMRSEDEKARSKDLSKDDFSLPRLKISAEASFLKDKPSLLTLEAKILSRWDNSGGGDNDIGAKISVSFEGAVPTRAENSPLTDEGVRTRLSKMGNTPFILDSSDISLEIEEGINLPPSAINSLRRAACDKLESEFLRTLDKICSLSNPAVPSEILYNVTDIRLKKKQKTAIFFDADKLSKAFKKKKDILSCIDISFVPLFKYKEISDDLKKSVNGVYLPPIIMEYEWSKVKSELLSAKALGASYALIGNISHISMVNECGLLPIGDFRLNISNRESALLWYSLGVESTVLSAELTLQMARDIGVGIITFGRIPLMITERCFIKENFGCEICKSGKASLTDRRGAKFPMMKEYEHRTIIFNSQMTYMGDKHDELARFGIMHEHFIFSSESEDEIILLTEAYKNGENIDIPHRRIGKR